MSENRIGKKPYVMPMVIFEDYRTGELSGSPEMLEQIKRECQELEEKYPMTSCPFEPFPCYMRGIPREDK